LRKFYTKTHSVTYWTTLITEQVVVEVWPSTHVTELCLQLTAGSGPF